ncbi:MAG: hypothetical protein WAV79_20345, partial [Anaerolineae bacterium]
IVLRVHLLVAGRLAPRTGRGGKKNSVARDILTPFTRIGKARPGGWKPLPNAVKNRIILVAAGFVQRGLKFFVVDIGNAFLL